MTSSKSLCLPMLLVASSVIALAGAARAAQPSLPDFSGIWRLDEQHSDSPSDIDMRLRAERKLEQPTEQPATAAATGASPTGQASGQHAGHAGGRGMGGGGMGGGHSHGGGRGHNNKAATTDVSAPVVFDPPPLLADDSLLNVQQDAKGIRVVVGDKDQLDGRLDGIIRQSLNGSAMVQTQLTADSLQVSMQFDDDVQLQQSWVQSPDGHHLTVTERWITPAVKQPIVFKRSYDRLDI
jgi:hypothetical protein